MGSRRPDLHGELEGIERVRRRGGPGVRAKLGEESFRPTFRLNGVRAGQTVSQCLQRYTPHEQHEHRIGMFVRLTSTAVYIRWDDDPDNIEYWTQGDARYEVFRDRWRISNFRGINPLDAGKIGVSAPQADALTTEHGNDRVAISPLASDEDSKTEEDDMTERMSRAEEERRKAQQALANGDLQERETYTAKQVAARCGTDSKTMRKFFRSSHSTVEPVGQGGRYEFDAKDLPQIKQEFDTWRKRSGRTPIHKNLEAAASHTQAKKPTTLRQRRTAEKTSTGALKCRNCRMVFSDTGAFNKHNCDEPPGGKVRCILCEDVFKSRTEFAGHECSVGDRMTDAQVKELTTTGKIICEFCTNEFKNPGVFVTHTCIGDAEPTEEELAAIDANGELDDLDLSDL